MNSLTYCIHCLTYWFPYLTYCPLPNVLPSCLTYCPHCLMYCPHYLMDYPLPNMLRPLPNVLLPLPNVLLPLPKIFPPSPTYYAQCLTLLPLTNVLRHSLTYCPPLPNILLPLKLFFHLPTALRGPQAHFIGNNCHFSLENGDFYKFWSFTNFIDFNCVLVRTFSMLWSFG